ncbi:MAG: LysE family translocator [Candidatus Puniceispirillaceae bacterium]
MTAYLALLGFIAFMVGTPGPANLVAMLAGVTQGLRGCAGFIFGLIVGKIGLNLFIGFGFGVVLAADPVLQTAFTYASASYMIWLAVRSWPRSVNPARNQHHTSAVAFRFRDGVIVHPINPKAWVMVVLAWGHFAPALGDFSLQLPVVILSFAICQLVFHSLWCGLGAYLGKSFAYSQRLAKLMIMLTILVVLAALLYAPPA